GLGPTRRLRVFSPPSTFLPYPPRQRNRWLAKAVRGTAGAGGTLQAPLGLCYEHRSTPLTPERVRACPHRTRSALGGKVLSPASSSSPSFQAVSSRRGSILAG